MQTNPLWTGRAYHSLENCLVNTTGTGTEITSTIIGLHEEKIYKIEYRIQTNPEWETISFEISCRHNQHMQHLKYTGDGKGNWFEDGQSRPQFAGCIDIDIPLTPFTNSLPINRMKLKAGEERVIRVLYLDLLKREYTPLRQKYLRLSEYTYRYENVPNDFEADIIVDATGLVVDYPQLFVRTAAEQIKP